MEKRKIVVWTEREKKILTLLARHRKLSAKKILSRGFFPNRTVNSVSQQIRRLRLADPVRSQRYQNAARFPVAQLQEFHAFLKAHSHQLGSHEIAKEFGVSRSMVKYHQRKLGIVIGWEEAISLPTALQKRQRLCELLRQWNLARGVKQRQQRLLNFEKRLKRFQTTRPDTPCRTCNRCGRHWPPTDYFFLTGRKFRARIKRKVKVLRYRCRLCRTPDKRYASA